MNSFFKRSALLLFLMLGAFSLAHAQGDVVGQVLARINQARAEAGLAPLARNAQLDAAALAHAQDLLQNGVGLGHRGSNGSSILQRITNAGYTSAVVGENWAAYRTLDQSMNFWLNDAPHRRNILDARFREIGIGIVTRPNGGLIIITDFAAPAHAPEFAPAVPSTRAPTKARATPTRAQAVTAKPTRTPTRKPTPKPTRAQIAPVLTPTREAPRVALATQPQTGSAKSLGVRGRVARIRLQGEASVSIRALETNGDPMRMMFGAGLIFGGLLLLGVAYVGHRNYRTRSLF